MSRALRMIAAVLIALVALPAPAKEATPGALDPVAAQRLVRLAEELRCLVCQNRSLADSNAQLALDLRREIREQVQAGGSDAQVIDYMVQRYGDFVLYRPPFKITTALLWLGPFVLLLAAAAWLYRTLARRRRAAPAALSADEQTRAAALLGWRGGNAP